MRPEQEFNRRELRKEMQNRLRFLQDRIRVTPIELAYALGRTAALPSGMKLPPRWALEAARVTWARVFAPLAELEAEVSSGKINAVRMWELFAQFRSMVSYLDSPSAEILQKEKELPALVALRKTAATQISKDFLRYIQRVERNFRCNLPNPTLEELADHAAGTEKGHDSFVTTKGELPAMKTATSQIYYLLWFYWPKRASTLGTTPEVHTWLTRQHGVICGDDLVGGILTVLNKAG